MSPAGFQLATFRSAPEAGALDRSATLAYDELCLRFLGDHVI